MPKSDIEGLRVRVSRRLFEAVKLSSDPAYIIAQRAEIHPATLSKLLHGAEPLRPQDPRVLAVARAVGVPPEHAFAVESPETSR